MSTLQEQIRDTLNVNREEGQKKQISLMLDERLLQMIDIVAEQFKMLTNGKISTRNQVIEEASKEYVKAAADVLLQDHYINIEELCDPKGESLEEPHKENNVGWNLALYPARNDGFEKVFLNKKQWYSVRIASWRIPYIKYVACYRGYPYSGITHYAKVKEIKQYQNTNKYIIYFDEVYELDKMIPLGNSDVMSIRRTNYTTLEKLKKSDEVSDVIS